MKNMEWLQILSKDKNYRENDFIKVVVDSCYSFNIYKDKIQSELMTYRNILLQQMDTPDFTKTLTKENLQKWFLEPIDKQKFDYIKEDMKLNYWTIKELWNKCREESIGILSASNLINTNIKFYDGMKIMHKGHIVNILDKYDVRQIEFIQNNANFNMKQFMYDLEMDTLPMALSHQQKVISKHRMESTTDFKLAKENIEYILAQHITNSAYNMLVQSMKTNHWSLKELVQESLRQDLNLFMISGVHNRVMA